MNLNNFTFSYRHLINRRYWGRTWRSFKYERMSSWGFPGSCSARHLDISAENIDLSEGSKHRIWSTEQAKEVRGESWATWSGKVTQDRGWSLILVMSSSLISTMPTMDLIWNLLLSFSIHVGEQRPGKQVRLNYTDKSTQANFLKMNMRVQMICPGKDIYFIYLFNFVCVHKYLWFKLTKFK